jgi:hypothetical protein
VTLLVATWLGGCECTDADVVALDSDASSGPDGDTTMGSSTVAVSTTDEAFDASRWIGRYHFENVFLPFGERGDPHGSHSLVNFEILPDGRASMFFDNCSFEVPVTIAYEWLPSEDEGWLSLYPGAGETSLRFMANDDVETLRVQLVEPCRELVFDIDGRAPGFTIVRPGAACWVDRCTVPGIMQVDYCEGEEPPPCP